MCKLERGLETIFYSGDGPQRPVKAQKKMFLIGVKLGVKMI